MIYQIDSRFLILYAYLVWLLYSRQIRFVPPNLPYNKIILVGINFIIHNIHYQFDAG